MKAKVTTGTSTQKLMDYLTHGTRGKNADAELIGGNCLSTTPADLVAEIEDAQAARPAKKVNTLHVSLRPPKGEHLTREQWLQVAETQLDNMGFNRSSHPYCVYLHDDEHIHIAASVVGYDGTVWSDSHSVYKAINSTWKIEKQFELTQTKTLMPGFLKIRVKENEKRMCQRLGIVPPKIVAGEIIEKAITSCGATIEGFIDKCKESGLTVTKRGSGLTFKLEGVQKGLGDLWTGSQIHRNYTFNEISKRLKGFEKELRNDFIRDIQTVVAETERDRGPIDRLEAENTGMSNQIGRISDGNDTFKRQYNDSDLLCGRASRIANGRTATVRDRHKAVATVYAGHVFNAYFTSKYKGVDNELRRRRVNEVFAGITGQGGGFRGNFADMGRDSRQVGTGSGRGESVIRDLAAQIQGGYTSLDHVGRLDCGRIRELAETVRRGEQQAENHARCEVWLRREDALVKIRTKLAQAKTYGGLAEALEAAVVSGLCPPDEQVKMEKALVFARGQNPKGGLMFEGQTIQHSHTKAVGFKPPVQSIATDKSKGKDTGFGL